MPSGNPKSEAPADAPNWKERLRAIRNVRPLLGMMWKTGPFLCVANILLRLILSVMPVTQLWIGKLIIDEVVRVITHRVGDPRRIWLYLSFEIGLSILGNALVVANNLCDSLLGDKFSNYVSIRLMEHANTLDLASFEDPVFYDKLDRARRQVSTRLGMLTTLAGMCQNLLTLISLSTAMVAFSPWLLLLMVGTLIPPFMGEAKFAILGYSILYRWTPERREIEYLRLLGASNQSAKEVKIFGLGRYLTDRANGLFTRYYKENADLAVRRAGTSVLLNLFPQAGYYCGYALILLRTLAGSLTLGDLTFLAGSFARSRTIIENLFTSFNNVAEQALYVKDLFDFFESKPTVVSKPHAIPGPQPIRSGFEFRDVDFSYPGSGRKILSKINFRFDVGERIALIGENGAGKTTLVKLLARLYDPTAGSILLDGVDLRDYKLEDLQREIGVIFQDYVRYDMMVKENIGIGRVEDMHDEQRIRTAAAQSMASQLIDKLPLGYDQMLGRRFDGGAELSTGQWQKIALARAYMRNAQVLILDEPTASLDARAEYDIFQRFSELTSGRMAVLISHRFSTVRMVDRILVLENGTIAEQGSHDQLVALGGRYAELFDLQAAWYR
ncbi:MAG TPA: ABC transporter ATP-binding protein [Candidatus Angelobacter sp.]